MAALLELNVAPPPPMRTAPRIAASQPASLPTSALLAPAARRLPDVAAHAFLLSGLFVLVVVLQIALSSALHAAGLAPGFALAAAGAGVLAFVLAVHLKLAHARKVRRAAIEAARLRQGLPDGPCCLICRAEPGGAAAPAWEAEREIRAAYPRVAHILGVEGAATVEFEIDGNGAAVNISCVDAWPARIFFRRVAEALAKARFRPRAGVEFGPNQRHRVTFEFRIAGLHKQEMRLRNMRSPEQPALRPVN
jgi:TonB family protein